MASTDHPPERRSRSSQRMSQFLHRQSVKAPVVRVANTYRLEPHNPLNREMCQLILKTLVDNTLHEFVYSAKQAQDLCSFLSGEIKTRVKMKNYDRYRLVVIVTIGEKCMQGFKSVATFLWDAEKDGYVKYIYDRPEFFANVMLYYLYYD